MLQLIYGQVNFVLTRTTGLLQTPTQLSYSCPPTLTASSLLGRRQGLQRWLGLSKLAFFLYSHFTPCELINPEKWHKHVGQIFCSHCRKHSLEEALEKPELLSKQAGFVPGQRNDTWTPGVASMKVVKQPGEPWLLYQDSVST